MGRVIVKDAPWRKILARAKELHTAHARVGLIGSRAGENDGKLTIAELGAIHEFGAPGAGIPERSFIRSTFYVRRANALRSMLARISQQIIKGGLEVRRGLAMLGAWGAAEVKNTITEINIPPPLAQKTIDAKGSSTPLIDTGQLVGAISWDIVEGGVE